MSSAGVFVIKNLPISVTLHASKMHITVNIN